MNRPFILRIFAFFFFCLTSILSASERYHNTRYHFHLNQLENWDILEAPRQKSITFTHPNQIASINVTGYYYETPVTANRLHLMRMGSRYDGWMNIYERPSTDKELAHSGAETSYLSVYSKHLLSSNMNLEEMIVAEYCYTKGHNAYVITARSKKEHWKMIQPDIRTILDSFWIGEDITRPSYATPKKKTTGWTQDGVDATNRNYINSSVNLHEELGLLWEIKIPLSSSKPPSHSPILTGSQLFFSSSKTLFSLNNQTGTLNWTISLPTPLQAPPLYQNDILYYLTGNEAKTLHALIAKQGSLLFKQALNGPISNITSSERRLFFIQNQSLVALEGDTGTIAWSQELDLDPSFRPILYQDTALVINQAHDLILCDTKDGTPNWKQLGQGTLLFPPLIQNGIIVACFAKDKVPSQAQIIAYDIKTGNELWSFKNNSSALSIAAPPTSSGDLLFAPIQLKLQEEEKALPVLAAFDLRNGKLLWQYDSPF